MQLSYDIWLSVTLLFALQILLMPAQYVPLHSRVTAHSSFQQRR
jgi:hypothetical protein